MKRLTFLLLVTALVLSCAKNTPPIALISITPLSGTTDTSFTFDASGSYDTETPTNQLRFRWDWENDSIWDIEFSANRILNHRFSTPGIYNIRLEVIDEDGSIDKDIKTLLVSIENTHRLLL